MRGCSLDRESRDAAVTKSLWRPPRLSRGCDGRASIMVAMDVVAVLLGIAVFALLLWLVEGIDRV